MHFSAKRFYLAACLCCFTKCITDTVYRELERVVRQFDGAIWSGDERVCNVIEKASFTLNLQIANAGGLENWLPENTPNLCVRDGKIILKVNIIDLFLSKSWIPQVRSFIFCNFCSILPAYVKKILLAVRTTLCAKHHTSLKLVEITIKTGSTNKLICNPLSRSTHSLCYFLRLSAKRFHYAT